jgi:hypothetical protein
MARIISVLPLLVATACAPEYAYVPTTNATVTAPGRIAAKYPIPADAPQGNLQITSYGMTDVTPRSSPGEILRALHLRVVLTDNSATPWTFDTREQRVDLDGRGPLPPAFASANAGTAPPLVGVDRSGKRVVDLFFLLPENLQDAESLPEFDAVWRVKAGTTVAARRTAFARLAVDPSASNGDLDYGKGYYWEGPYWMNAEGYGGISHNYFDGGVLIHRAPGPAPVTPATAPYQ